MTTIAFDGRYFASDSQVSNAYNKDYSFMKFAVIQNGDILACAGVSGVAAYTARCIHWYMAGAKQEDWPAYEQADMLVAEKNLITGQITVKRFEDDGAMVLCPPQAATGSGTTYALCAMDVGARADLAVRSTAKFDNATNGNVFCFDLVDEEWLIKPDDTALENQAQAFRHDAPKKVTVKDGRLQVKAKNKSKTKPARKAAVPKKKKVKA